jgi:hypothetical protein
MEHRSVWMDSADVPGTRRCVDALAVQGCDLFLAAHARPSMTHRTFAWAASSWTVAELRHLRKHSAGRYLAPTVSPRRAKIWVKCGWRPSVVEDRRLRRFVTCTFGAP